MRTFFDHLSALYGPAAMAAWAAQWLPRLAAALVAVLIFFAGWTALRRVMDVVFRRARLDPTAAQFVRTATKAGISTVGALTALNQLGIDTTSILASLGVLGLTLGFAAQDTLSNVISGLFIFWDRPFVLGDLIEIDGEYGRVEQITLRSTRLVTPDGRMFAIPNKVVAGTKVASYTNFPNLRLDVDVTVGVGEDLSAIRRLLLEELAGDPAYSYEIPPSVHVASLNDYNVALQVRVWIEDETAHIPERFRLRERIFEVLRAGGVDMPFETVQLAPVQIQSAPTA